MKKAILTDNVEEVARLLSCLKDSNEEEEDNSESEFDTDLSIPLLQLAIKYGAKKSLDFLLHNGFDVNEKAPKTHKTALHIAAGLGDLDMIKTLINAGIDINSYDARAETAIFSAVRKNHPEIIPYLVKIGLDINSINSAFRTPLTVGFLKEKINVDSLKIFIDNGAIIQSSLVPILSNFNPSDIKDSEAKKCFEKVIIKCEAKEFIELDTIRNLEPLLNKIEPCEEMFDGYDLLETAASFNALSCFKGIITKYTKKDLEKTSALAIAIEQKNDDFVDLLLNAGASPNPSSKLTGDTALIAAVKNTNYLDRIIEKANIDLSLKNKDGYTALQVCIMRNDLETAKILLNKGAEFGEEDIEIAKKYFSFDIMKMIGIKTEIRPKRFPTKTNKSAALKYLINDDSEKLKELLESEKEMCSASKLNPRELFFSAASVGANNCLLLLKNFDNYIMELESTKRTPLTCAIESGSLETVRILIDLGYSIKEMPKDNLTVLFRSIKSDNLEMVKYFLEKGCDINEVTSINNYENITPLTYSLQLKREGIFEFLFKHPKIDLTISYQTIQELNEMAIMHSSLQMYKIINGNLDGFIVDNSIWSFILDDIMSGTNIYYIKMYAKEYKEVEYEKYSLLHLCCDSGHVEGVKFILNNCEYDLDKHNNEKNLTPLMIASETMNLEIVKMLIEHGASVNIPNNDGFVPLFYAFCFEDTDFILNLIELTDIEYFNRQYNGYNFLQLAAVTNDLKIFKAVLEKCASLRMLDGSTYKAAIDNESDVIIEFIEDEFFEIVIKFREEEIKKSIRKKNPSPKLLSAISSSDIKAVTEILKDQNINLNVEIENTTPLAEAIKIKSKPIIRILLNNGSDPNFGLPIFHALKNKGADIAKMLIKTGADINAKNKIGETPIFAAIKTGDENLVSFVVENGAEVNVLSNFNSSPLYQAVCMRNIEIIKILIGAGASSLFGISPLRQAKSLKLPEVENIILNSSNGICAVCRKEIKYKHIPCKHSVVCQECLKSSKKKIKNCPICGKQVLSIEEYPHSCLPPLKPSKAFQ